MAALLLGKTAFTHWIGCWVGEDNIKVGLREIRFCGMGHFKLLQDRRQRGDLVNTIMDQWVSQNVLKFKSI
jgi:hypothetical protein